MKRRDVRILDPAHPSESNFNTDRIAKQLDQRGSRQGPYPMVRGAPAAANFVGAGAAPLFAPMVRRPEVQLILHRFAGGFWCPPPSLVGVRPAAVYFGQHWFKIQYLVQKSISFG